MEGYNLQLQAYKRKNEEYILVDEQKLKTNIWMMKIFFGINNDTKNDSLFQCENIDENTYKMSINYGMFKDVVKSKKLGLKLKNTVLSGIAMKKLLTDNTFMLTDIIQYYPDFNIIKIGELYSLLDLELVPVNSMYKYMVPTDIKTDRTKVNSDSVIYTDVNYFIKDLNLPMDSFLGELEQTIDKIFEEKHDNGKHKYLRLDFTISKEK